MAKGRNGQKDNWSRVVEVGVGLIFMDEGIGKKKVKKPTSNNKVISNSSIE
jgi:hypothetical protein